MAYPKPEDVYLQGQLLTDGEQDHRWFTSPTGYVSATMPKKSSESKKRRLAIDYSISPDGPWITEVDPPEWDGFRSPGSTYIAQAVIGFLSGTLQPDTKYYFRIYAQRSDGSVGSEYFTGSFLTPYRPTTPVGSAPSSESEFPLSLEDLTFTWNFHDEGGQPQAFSYLRYRVAQTATAPAGPWTTLISQENGAEYEWFPELPCFPRDNFWDDDCDPGAPVAVSAAPTELTLPLTTFSENVRMEWQVANVSDPWSVNGPIVRPSGSGPNLTVNKLTLYPSEWSPSKYFTVTGPTSAPLLLDPTDNESVVVSEDRLFIWKFRDPVSGTQQTNALLRYRNVFDDDWTYVDLGVSHTDQSYLMPPDTLDPNVHYEWQVQTTNDRGEVSDWSASALFWGVVAPGSGNIPVTDGEPQGALGCGHHRAFIYDRGGKTRRGEVTHLTRIIWDRRRDDISEASLVVNNWDDDCGELLANTHCWQHELVIFREHPSGLYLERVWEGPIVRLAYTRRQVEVYAKDVMVYVYRRIMRQGYNDAYRLTDGVQQGLKTVVYRSAKLITNAMAYDDPNIIAHLTLLEYDDDARQSRVVEAFAKTVWEEVDDLAATAGLDYTTVGRRIVLNDTHRAIGNLPEMRDADFGDDLIVSEYGMQTANVFGVTNNAGVYGLADRLVNGEPQHGYGFIEQLASAYGEAVGAAPTEVLTPAAQAELEATLTSQAERNISGRHPTPVIVRVPDNTTLNPEVEVGVNQLVPGVWMPVRSDQTLRQVTQMQKLDKITMTEERGKETFTIVLSPAPNVNDDTEPVPGEDG